MGSENDITLRALESIDYQDCCIIDITGDCPLIDPFMIDIGITIFEGLRTKTPSLNNYISNVITRSYPDGFDIQIFNSKLLRQVYPIALDKKPTTNFGWDIMHYSGIMPEIFFMYNYPASERNWHPTWELTLDYEEDIEVISSVFNHFKRFDFTVDEVVDFINDNKYLLAKNKDCKRKISGE
jgi:spore coat polysaccharide biosynthesis protein SpsF